MKNLPQFMSTRVKTTISALKAAKESLLESRKNILDPRPLGIKLFSPPMQCMAYIHNRCMVSQITLLVIIRYVQLGQRHIEVNW